MRAWKWLAALAVAMGLGYVAWLERSVSDDSRFWHIATLDRYDLGDAFVRAREHIRASRNVQRAVHDEPVDTAHKDMRQQGCFGVREVRTVEVLTCNLLRKHHPAAGFIGEDYLSVRIWLSDAAIVNVRPKLQELRGYISKNTLAGECGFGFDPYIVSRACADIREDRYNVDLEGVADDPDTIGEARGNSYPRPLLVSHDAIRLNGLLRGVGGSTGALAGGGKSVPKKQHGPYARSRSDQGQACHDPLCIRVARRELGPPAPLGRAVMFLGIFCALGVWGSYLLIGWLTKPRDTNNRRER